MYVLEPWLKVVNVYGVVRCTWVEAYLPSPRAALDANRKGGSSNDDREGYVVRMAEVHFPEGVLMIVVFPSMSQRYVFFFA